MNVSFSSVGFLPLSSSDEIGDAFLRRLECSTSRP
mgnify:CR=1 FL=1